MRHVLSRAGRFLWAVGVRFWLDRCPRSAAALAYTSLLSLVPFFALMFAMLKGLGVQHRLEPWLLSRLGLSAEVTDRVVEYIDRTNVGTLGVLGTITLVLTAVSVLNSIESSLNHIWRVRRGRTWTRRLSDYTSVVLLTPFLVLAAVATTSTVREQALLRWLLQRQYIADTVVLLLTLAPFAINTIALAVLYAVMPNRRPHLPAVSLGAVVAGCAWQLVQRGHVALGVGAARYDAIYGALSQVPITLVWIYVSWVVILLGAEIAAVFELGPASARRAPPPPFAAALQLLVRSGQAFRAGKPVDVRRVARELRTDSEALEDIAERLLHHGLLRASAHPGRYFLGRDASTIDLATVDAAIDAAPPAADPRIQSVLAACARLRETELKKHSLAGLLDEAEHHG